MNAPVVLHVGTMKSGTSYLQRRLDANRAQLRSHGVLFPGRGWGEQVHAVGDLLGRGRLGGDREKRTGAWARLVEEVLDHGGPAVVSVELLGAAGPQRIEDVVTSFGGRDVRVVVTARDLNRSLLAMWQEGLQNGRTVSWDDHVRGVREDAGQGRRFWREQDLARMTRRWTEHVGSDRFALVTVPPPGSDPELLWRRFCTATGLDPRWCAPVPPANESLGAASAEVLLRLNALLAEHDLPWQDYHALVKRLLAKQVLAGRRDQEPPLGLPVARWVRHRARDMIAELDHLGVHVVGDLRELTPVAVPGARPDRVSAAATTEAAVAGLVGLVLGTATQDVATTRTATQDADAADRILEAAGA